jgi:hypothetical protein
VVRALDPSAFPRDAALIDAQGRLMFGDEVLALASRVTGFPVDVLFFACHLLSLALVWAALVLIGRSTYFTPWLTVALAAAFTLRHRIPRTSANSFEPYFHPRMLAFSLGALAVAAVLRRRFWTAIALVAVSAVVHVTTAMWFAILIGVAVALVDLRLRRLAAAAAVAATAFLAWALVDGPLVESRVRMDAPWLEAVAAKDSLLASQWPAWVWAANLGLLVVLWWAHRRRQAHGTATAEDCGTVWGATLLVAVFLITLPVVAARFAFPVQLQISRVFWLVDFVALVYAIGAIRRRRVAIAAAALLLVVSVSRGVYVMTVEHPERDLFAIHLQTSAWERAMAWVKKQPVDTHVLADPGHAWRYGTSVRVSAERDVLLEDVKDSAVAIYSREVALRYLERTRAIGDFNGLTADAARQLAARYDLDYLVTERDLPLPAPYQNEHFKIYALK